MSDEFKRSPIEQVRDHIAYETAKASEEYAKDTFKYQTGPGTYNVAATVYDENGKRLELIDKSQYIRALDRAHLAEERYEYAQKEIEELKVVIRYLEERNGRAEEGSVQVGDRESVPGKDGGASSAFASDRD